MPPSERSSLPLALRWSVDVGAPPVASAAPVSDDRLVYLALRTGQIAAYDLADGHGAVAQGGQGRSPAGDRRGLLFAATEDTIIAFRAADGALVWEAGAAITAPLLRS